MIDTGTILQNRYLVEKQIGQGGMGTVYIATDQRFNSLVAIKETIFTDAGLLRAFEREAQLLNSLRHPALPRVSDYFTEGDGQFLVMEYITGEDLAATLERKAAIPVEDVLLWTDQLLDALDYLHSQKMPVVHRDIKPQNLKIMSRNQIILLDFGLAKGRAGDVSQLSQTKSVFGYSRAYAPLEQIQGTGTDPRSDLYSLAATVYHLLTGTAPIDALTRATAVLNNSSDPLKPADALNSQVPAAVSALLQTALSLNSSLRPESAAAMREALNQAVTNPEAFIASEVAAGAIPSAQNAQLLNGGDAAIINQNAGANDVEATKYSGNSIERATFNTNPQQAGQKTILDASENPVPAAPGFQVRVAGESVQPAVFSDSVAPQPKRRSSALMPLGVAAAIAVLAGGGLATWYATGGASSSNNSLPQQNQSVIQVESAKPVSNETKPGSSSALPATESHNADKEVTDKNPATSTTTTTQTKTTENAPVTGRAEKPRNAQNEQNPEEQPEPDEEASDEQNQDDPPPPPVNIEDLRKVPEQIRERTKNLQRQKYEEAKRRIEEFNRKRAEQGLPTVELPPPPQLMRDQK